MIRQTFEDNKGSKFYVMYFNIGELERRKYFSP